MDSSLERHALVVLAAIGVATSALAAPWWVPVGLTVMLASILSTRLLRGSSRHGADREEPAQRSPDPAGIRTSDDPIGARLRSIADVAELTLGTADERSLTRAVTMGVCRSLAVDTCDLYRIDDPSVVAHARPQPSETAPPTTASARLLQAATAGSRRTVTCLRASGAIETDVTGGEDIVGLAVPVSGTSPEMLVVSSSTPRSYGLCDIAYLRSVAAIVALGRQRVDSERTALDLAHRDPLTGLVNRSAFVSRLRRALTRSRRRDGSMAVAIIGIDDLDRVNDSSGHAAGDTVLEQSANRLVEMMRPGDLAARFGDREFAVLALDPGAGESAKATTDRLRDALAAPVKVGEHDVQLTISAGFVTASGDLTAEDLLQRADVALGAARSHHSDRVVEFAPAMLEATTTRLRTETDLRQALDEGSLRLFYQPVVDLVSGHVVSAEALIRWLRPGKGMVSPSEFIPISEETGLIEEIGRWVIEEAVAQAAKWSAQGQRVRTLVNVSRRQVVSGALVADIDRALADHGLDPALLTVELTEKALSGDGHSMTAALSALTERGVSIALDDFGTTYTSMAHLKSLPVDIVKIDRSFVSGIDRSGTDYAITAAMIQVCRALGKTVIAEGVETAAQLELLRELGCHQGQGYLFAPAMHDLDPAPAPGSWVPLVVDRI